MSTELVTTTGNSVVEKQSWARAMAPAALLPKAYRDNPANLFLAAELADSLGIDRINALTSIHVVEGKPSASADLMAALVRRAGHRLRIQGDDRGARAVLIRHDDPEFEYEAVWTIERARTAGLVGKDVWKKYAAAMLRSRAITEVIRAGASEVLVGMIYTPEELGVTVDPQGNPTRPMPVTQSVTVADILGESEPVDAEIVNDHPISDMAEAVELITDAQSKHLHALVTDLGLSREQKLAGLSQIAGVTLTTSADLTKAQATVAIDALKKKVDDLASLTNGEPAQPA